MKKVITYGTYDHLHQGHINILRRAKALGDYLIVGVTTENFDINRGKINVQQSLMERIEAVKALHIADEVFPEEYLGQKIDDIKRLSVDVFAVGSDWVGHFDYLREYCEVVYLPRTEGISSTLIREKKKWRLGAVGVDPAINKIKNNAKFVNGLVFDDLYLNEKTLFDFSDFQNLRETYTELLDNNDIVYVAVRPKDRFSFIRQALLAGKHVISESPICLKEVEVDELFDIAKKNEVVLFDSIKTAFLLSFSRMILLVKGGIIGDVRSIDVTCTSLENKDWLEITKFYSSVTGWGSLGLLPVFKILGLDFLQVNHYTLNSSTIKDVFTKINVIYPNAVATVSLGIGVKSEGDLKISGTKGYIYVPAPWWKSEYFEVRFENPKDNKPFFYQSDGEGLRLELVHLIQCINDYKQNYYVENSITKRIVSVINEIMNEDEVK